jgi:hypothetical protein
MNDFLNDAQRGQNQEELKFVLAEVDIDLLSEGSADESSSSSEAELPYPRVQPDFFARPATPQKRQYKKKVKDIK